MGQSSKIEPVFRKKLDLLAEHVISGITATLITSLALVIFLWSVTDHNRLITWFSLVAGLSCLRYAHIYYFKTSEKDISNCKTWRLLFYASFCLSGLLWGLSIVYLAPVDNLIYFGANAFWILAIIAGAIGSYSFLNRIFISFSALACLPGIIYLLSLNENIYASIAAAISVAFIYLTLSSRKLNKVIDSNIRSTFDEIDKSKKLNTQKNILHSIAEAAEFLLEDSWENSTHDFLKKLGTSIDVSRIQIFENTEDNPEKINTPTSRFHWHSDNAPEYDDEIINFSYDQLKLSRWETLLSNGESIHGEVGSFPEDESAFLQSINIKSLFVIPIFVSNKWWGFISFDECKKQRVWTDEETDALKTAAAVIGAAIKRTWTENKLSYNASHDSLTKLHNRRAFEIELRRLLGISQTDTVDHVLCYLDLDRFKIINDTCGHNAGDQLLIQLSDVMKQSIRKNDFIARIGGDEFGILLQNISIEDAKNAVKKLQKSIERFSFHWEGNAFRVGASIGIVPVDYKCTDPDKVLQAADNACRAMKQSSTNQIRIYNIDDTEISHERTSSQSYIHINKALENDEFTLLFQPITKTTSANEKWKHFEVLIRMNSENNSLISPHSFLPTAERYNLMNKIDRWVFKACIKKLHENKTLYDHVNMLSINISGATLCEPTFRNYVIGIFEAYNVPANKICFEITETAAVSNLLEAIKFIEALRSLGCKFALDDFGTGFTSFENMKNLPVDYVKIDGSFIRDINTNPVDYEMVDALHKISKLMNMETIAEFVESQEILDTLNEIGITYAQGYAISKPLHLQELLDPNHRIIGLDDTIVA